MTEDLQIKKLECLRNTPERTTIIIPKRLFYYVDYWKKSRRNQKIRKTMINYEEELITLPASITKARKKEYIDITPSRKVLKQIQSMDGNTKHIDF